MQDAEVDKMFPLSLYSEAWALKSGRKVAPRMVIIHPTNRCNHKCSGCEYNNVHTSKSVEMGGERLQRLINEIADLGTASVLFSGGGEPTMHPLFADALREANKRGLLIGIFTNGALIEQSLADCIAQTATFVRISVDASNAEAYAAIRQIKPLAFNQLKSAVKRIVEAKARFNSGLQIGLKFLVRSCNVEEIAAFGALAQELGVENIQFKPLRNEVGELDLQQIRTAQRLVEQIRENFPDLKVWGKISSEIKVTTPCWISPLKMVVSAEGDIHICNYFNHRRQTHTFGNINQGSLESAWFSDEHRQALTTIQTSECELYDCRFHKLNTEMLHLLENHRGQLDFI